MSLKLMILCGSTRPGRIGPKVGRWCHEVARAHGGFDAELVDLGALNLPLLDEPAHPSLRQYTQPHTQAWSRLVGAADAFVFVTPEYDFFPPAALVNAVQCLVHEWARKPAAVVSYGGVSGGLRAAQVLRQLLSGLNMAVISPTVPLPNVAQMMGADGAVQAPEATAKTAGGVLDELHRWAVALKPLR